MGRDCWPLLLPVIVSPDSPLAPLTGSERSGTQRSSVSAPGLSPGNECSWLVFCLLSYDSIFILSTSEGSLNATGFRLRAKHWGPPGIPSLVVVSVLASFH